MATLTTPNTVTTGMRTILRYSLDLFIRPNAAFQSRLADPRRLGFGFLGPVVLAAVYFVGISTALALNVEHLPQSPVLNIPPEQYYAYERFYILPVAIAGTILAAGAIQLLAHGWDGPGRFEDLFALLGFSLIVVAVGMGLPDLALAVLAGIGVSVPIGWVLSGPQIWLGTLWYLLLNLLAVKQVERLSWGRSVVLALLGFVANGVVSFVFIR